MQANWAESNYQTPLSSPANFERKSFFLPNITSDNTPIPVGADATFRLLVGPRGNGSPESSPNGQPYWLSRVALTPQNGPLPIRVEAVIYAFNESWFVIPPPFFNDDSRDTRENLAPTGRRLPGTLLGANSAIVFPFYNEALNVDVELLGSVTENMPAHRPRWRTGPTTCGYMTRATTRRMGLPPTSL